MRRKLICLVLCAALLLALAACGGKTPQPASVLPDETPLELGSGLSYAEIYAQFLAVYGALLDEVERRVETHNAILKGGYPGDYYLNSNYLMQVYVPFATAYPGLVSPLTDDDLDTAEKALRATFPDAVLTETAPGRYEAVYTYKDMTSGATVERQGACIWERDGAAGSFRVRAFVDGELTEFTEFVPQGNDLYFLYTLTDKALVRYADGEISGIWHAHAISDPPMGTFPGDMRLNSLTETDPFPAGTVGVSWITGDVDAEYVLTLENNVMVYNGRIAQDLLDVKGSKIGVAWQDIDPITLLQ